MPCRRRRRSRCHTTAETSRELFTFPPPPSTLTLVSRRDEKPKDRNFLEKPNKQPNKGVPRFVQPTRCHQKQPPEGRTPSLRGTPRAARRTPARFLRENKTKTTRSSPSPASEQECEATFFFLTHAVSPSTRRDNDDDDDRPHSQTHPPPGVPPRRTSVSSCSRRPSSTRAEFRRHADLPIGRARPPSGDDLHSTSAIRTALLKSTPSVTTRPCVAIEVSRLLSCSVR